MAAKRAQRMTIVIELAQQKQDAAAHQFQQANEARDLQRQKLSELEQYYQFYEQRSNTQRKGVRASELSQARHFLRQLQSAIHVQQQQLNLAEQQVLDARNEWHRCYMKVQSLQELQQRYQQEEEADADRREQRQMDEWVNQRANITGQNNGPGG